MHKKCNYKVAISVELSLFHIRKPFRKINFAANAGDFCVFSLQPFIEIKYNWRSIRANSEPGFFLFRKINGRMQSTSCRIIFVRKYFRAEEHTADLQSR